MFCLAAGVEVEPPHRQLLPTEHGLDDVHLEGVQQRRHPVPLVEVPDRGVGGQLVPQSGATPGPHYRDKVLRATQNRGGPAQENRRRYQKSEKKSADSLRCLIDLVKFLDR